jgi:para-nitrobenzyl esterase
VSKFTNGFKNSPIIVATECGQVKGIQKSSILGRNYFRFNSIPYMKAPIGKLRFRDAQSPEKWNETLDSNIDRPSYLLVDRFEKTVAGQEDAGILSISTPYLNRKLPVAVYMHGGGFRIA